MTKGMERALTENGYRKMLFSEEQEGYRIYYDTMQSLVNAVIFVDAGKYNSDLLTSIRTSMTLQLGNAGYNTHYMTVICLDSESPAYESDLSVAKQVCSDDAFSWVYDVSEKRIYIYENQVDDFYGLKRIIDNASVYDNSPDNQEEKEYIPPTFKERLKSAAAAVKTLPKVTSALVLINVIVFVICTLTGSLLYNKGAVGLKLIEGPGDVYRIITSMFLHMGVTHIFSNMLLLFFLGNEVEKEVGTILYAIMYFAAGIVATIAVFIEEIVTDKDMVVVGASGAIFGLLGVLFALVLFKRVTKETMSPGRVFMVIILSIHNGFTQANVANTAHIGGLIAGFILGVIFCLVKPEKRGEKPNEN